MPRGSRRALEDLRVKMQALVDASQKTDRRMSDAENRVYLQDLGLIEPRDDKMRIEEAKGGLLRDLCWVLRNEKFEAWRKDDAQGRLLWINGDPGKGKTMLLCGIIDDLIQSNTHTANISFFFCQATYNRINNAAAVLRGLIF